MNLKSGMLGLLHGKGICQTGPHTFLMAKIFVQRIGIF